MDIKETGGKNATAGYQNLADLQYQAGEIEKGLESAKRALEMAEKADSDESIMISKAYVAQILHLSGASKDAEKWFREANDLEKKSSGYRLYSRRGVAYADFFISNKRIDEALELTRQNLQICQEENFVNDISRCHRCLGAIKRIKGNHQEAQVHLQETLELARKVGVPSLEIEALLEYGRLYLVKGEYNNAINAGNDVLKICERTGFLLYEPDAEVVLAKAYLAQKDLKQAKTFANSAHVKAKKMGYKLAEDDAAKLLKEIGA